jgi:hypothetical protein
VSHVARPQRIPDDTDEPTADLDDAAAPASGRAQESRGTAATAQARADDAHRRAAAARDAAGRAITEYARDSHRRVAELYAGLALCHEQEANALRLREALQRS